MKKQPTQIQVQSVPERELQVQGPQDGTNLARQPERALGTEGKKTWLNHRQGRKESKRGHWRRGGYCNREPVLITDRVKTRRGLLNRSIIQSDFVF